MTPQQIYEELATGVVMVLSDFSGSGANEFGVPQSAQALGTGFVVDREGYILTNAHVVDENGQQASAVTVVFNKGGSETQRVKGELVGVDQGSDVALIKVDPNGLDLKALPLGDSEEVAVGEPVVAIGNPLGYDFSITSGIVSATGRTLQAPNGMSIPNGIQTDAAINQGNSGGPLIDGRGRVIGINEQIASQGGGNDGLGFAVPINTAVRVMEQLRETGTVEYAWLGVAGQTLTADLADMFDLTADSGAMVEQVVPDSPAAAAGLRGGDRTVTVQGQQYTIGGDVIVKIDGEEVASFEDLVTHLATKKPGDKITLTVVRGDETIEVPATLAARPSDL
jgi:S1-C subfamily serine protease